MMARLALVALVVSQCPVTTGAYDVEVARIRDAWSADASLPADECGVPRVDVANLGGDIAGYQWGDVLTIARDLDEQAAHAAVRHEVVHWLAWCTGLAGWGDPGHSIAALWGADGVLARAEASP